MPTVSNAEKIRNYAREKYVLPARNRKEARFSIRAGDIVRELGMTRGTPAVCSALGGRKFWQNNNLRLIEMTGPPSGQSTTVVYTYEFSKANPSPAEPENPWLRLRGALKDIFADLGGGEAYLRAERDKFHASQENK